mgnify:FL=1
MVYCLISLFGILSCKNSQTVYEGNHRDKKIVLKSIEVKGFSTNSISYSVQLGNLPSITIDAQTTDLRGVPYSDDVFGNSLRYYLEKDSALYQDEAVHNNPITPTMLYLSEKKFDRESFDDYADFFRQKWPEIVAFINKDYAYIKNNIIGLVYGKRENFIKEFKGLHQGKKMILMVYADGRVCLINDDKWRQENYSGLSPIVQMPGKKLFLDMNPQNGGLTKEEISGLRDKDGKTLENDFVIVEKP